MTPEQRKEAHEALKAATKRHKEACEAAGRAAEAFIAAWKAHEKAHPY